MKKSILSLPVCFTTKDEVSNKDDRFINVTIDVLHTGLNFNGSIFDKNVVDENIETIKNTPILGFIQVLPDGEKDFKGHEYIITKIDKNGVERKYIGNAYGLVPESCNPRWITKLCDDGEEREFLQVDALVWTKFEDSANILMRDIEKGHSMELFPDSVDGYEDENEIFHFTKFSFDGCCILGNSDDTQPAMINSNIIVNTNNAQFTMSDFVKNLQSELSNKFISFTKLVEQKNNQGGVEIMSDKKDFTQTVLEQISEIASIVREHESVVGRWGDELPRFEFVDIQDNEVIVSDRKDNYNYYGFSVSISGDKAEIDFNTGKRKKIRYEDYEEGSVDPSVVENGFDFGNYISNLENDFAKRVEEANEKVIEVEKDKATVEENYSQIKADYDEIKPKYDEYVLAEEKRQNEEMEAKKDAKFAEYEDLLADSPDFVALKERKAEMSVDEIDKECAVIYVKLARSKASFSRQNSSLNIGLMDDGFNDDDNHVATKYGNIRVSK